MLGANDLNCVDVPLNPTHSLSVFTGQAKTLNVPSDTIPWQSKSLELFFTNMCSGQLSLLPFAEREMFSSLRATG